MGDLVRMEVRLEAMTFNMAQFLNTELEKRKEEFHALSKKVIESFDVEKEIREQFEFRAREYIRGALQRESSNAAWKVMQDWEIQITIKPKVTAEERPQAPEADGRGAP